jgi:putative transcriptional regulator
MTTKKRPITRVRLDRDREFRKLTASARTIVKPRFDPKRVDSAAAFAPDKDLPKLTRRELRSFRPVNGVATPDVSSVRRRLRLSQGAFADLFGIPLGTVKDWEQGRRAPDAPARAYLRVIARDPDAVRRALKTAAE